MNQPTIDLAYRHCERLTRDRARNFYYGIRLLAPAQRSAMCALYAMARRIDDVGDGQMYPQDQRAGALDAISRSVAVLAGAGKGDEVGAVPPGDPVLLALADAHARFELPLNAFDELVEGCRWDLEGRHYDHADQLVAYCQRVAGTIGRLSLAIYQPRDPEAATPLADALGVALQLTNILRDVVEDRDVMGRIYLPAQDLERFGVGPGLDGDPDQLMALVCFETGRAVEWYSEGLQLLSYLDRRSRACTAAMAGIYHRLLLHIRANPLSVFNGRVSLSPPQKAAVAAMALARGAAAA